MSHIAYDREGGLRAKEYLSEQQKLAVSSKARSEYYHIFSPKARVGILFPVWERGVKWDSQFRRITDSSESNFFML